MEARVATLRAITGLQREECVVLLQAYHTTERAVASYFDDPAGGVATAQRLIDGAAATAATGSDIVVPPWNHAMVSENHCVQVATHIPAGPPAPPGPPSRKCWNPPCPPTPFPQPPFPQPPPMSSNTSVPAKKIL